MKKQLPRFAFTFAVFMGALLAVPAAPPPFELRDGVGKAVGQFPIAQHRAAEFAVIEIEFFTLERTQVLNAFVARASDSLISDSSPARTPPAL